MGLFPVPPDPLIAELAILRPSWYALGWFVLSVAMVHRMILAEEAHLWNRHGEAYDRYCERVPRYLGVPKSPLPEPHRGT